jgi:phage repressor protein C with HTH and peptisase S24 domain
MSIAGLMVADKPGSYHHNMSKQETHRRNITYADLAARDRLAAIWDRKAKDLGVTEMTVADLLDRSQGLVNQYRLGRLALNYKAVLAFAQALQVDPSDIRDDLPEQQLQSPKSTNRIAEKWTDIASYNQHVAAGDGIVPEEYAETHTLKFKVSSLQRKGLHARKLNVFYAKGDSMEPRIHDGDAVLFDSSDTALKDGAIFVVKLNGELLVKRLNQYGKQWFLVSDNGSDPKWKRPIVIDQSSEFEVLGRVRWIGSWED